MSGPPNIQRFPTSLATASTPGAMPATEYAKTAAFSLDDAQALGETVTDVISNSGGAAVGDVMIFSDEGVLAAAQADTLAHATGIRGVWSGSRLWRRGEKAIVNFSDTPVKGTKCYLSSTAKKAQTAAPTAAMVPRCLGIVDRVLTASTAEVFLDYDELRDNSIEWLLETYAPTIDAASYVFALNPALWSGLRFEGREIGPVVLGSSALELRADSVQSGISMGSAMSGTTGYPVVQNPNFAAIGNLGQCSGEGALGMFFANLRKGGTSWYYDAASFGRESTAGTGGRYGQYTGRLGAVTTGIQLYIDASGAFRANTSVVQLWGRVS